MRRRLLLSWYLVLCLPLLAYAEVALGFRSLPVGNLFPEWVEMATPVLPERGSMVTAVVEFRHIYANNRFIAVQLGSQGARDHHFGVTSLKAKWGNVQQEANAQWTHLIYPMDWTPVRVWIRPEVRPDGTPHRVRIDYEYTSLTGYLIQTYKYIPLNWGGATSRFAVRGVLSEEHIDFVGEMRVETSNPKAFNWGKFNNSTSYEVEGHPIGRMPAITISTRQPNM
jgi:hypothetical protein